MEKTKELKEKLERFAEKKKESVQALDKVLLEKKVLENWNSEEEPDVEDIQELIKQANFLELDCSREGLAKARENLKKTETLLGINLRKSNAKVREVLEEGGEVMKEWEIEFQPDEDDPDVVIRQFIVTKDTPGSTQLPSLHSVRLEVDGLGDLDDDFRAAIALCEEEKEPQRFTHLVINYLPLIKEREDLLQIPFMPDRSGDRKYVLLKPGGEILFRNSLSQQLFLLNIRVR